MAENTWRTHPVLLSEIEPQHLKLLGKIAQLPGSQQTYLETIIDGLGTGKTAAQRTAAKNTVMTILNLTEEDVTLIKQIRRLSRVHQLDLQRFVQDQLTPDVEVETLAAFAPSSPAPGPSSERSATVNQSVESSLSTEQEEVAVEEMVHEIPPTTEEFLEDLPTEEPPLEKITVEEMGEEEPTELLEEEIDDSPEFEEPAVTTDYGMMEATLLESSVMQSTTTSEIASESLQEASASEMVLEQLATSPSEATVLEAETQDVALSVPLVNEETQPAETQSDNRVHIAVLGKALVVSSDQVIHHLDKVLQDKLGIAFRNVFGLLKSQDPKAAERLDKQTLTDLLNNGIVVENVRYQVDYQTHT